MNKAGRTHDELFKNFSKASAPSNTFAGAAEPNFSTFPVETVGPNNSIEAAPVAGLSREKEYAPPVSNLPMVVTQAESKERNCTWQSQNPWDTETENAPILAGTRSGTPSATPTSPVVMPTKQRDEGHDPEGNPIEDAFSRLRRMGGGY
jgi:hypothetical protein